MIGWPLWLILYVLCGVGLRALLHYTGHHTFNKKSGDDWVVLILFAAAWLPAILLERVREWYES